MIRRTPCWEEYLNLDNETYFKMYYDHPEQSYYNGSQQDFIKSSEFETNCNEMINIHPYNGPAVASEQLGKIEELPVPQALSSSSSFASQDLSVTSSADDAMKR